MSSIKQYLVFLRGYVFQGNFKKQLQCFVIPIIFKVASTIQFHA